MKEIALIVFAVFLYYAGSEIQIRYHANQFTQELKKTATAADAARLGQIDEYIRRFSK